MVQPRGLYTLEMWQRLPFDGNRYELVEGELLVTPSPARVHQLLVYRLIAGLGAYVDAHALGQVWPGPIDVFVGTHTVRAFVATSVFENAVLKDRLLADAFGDWLFARAGDFRKSGIP